MNNISIDCLEYLIKGLNCHYEKNFIITEEKDGKYIISEKDNNLNNEIQLVLSQKPGQIKFVVTNFDDSKKDAFLKIFEKFSPKIVDKFLEMTLSDNLPCSLTGNMVEIICNFMSSNFS